MALDGQISSCETYRRKKGRGGHCLPSNQPSQNWSLKSCALIFSFFCDLQENGDKEIFQIFCCMSDRCAQWCLIPFTFVRLSIFFFFFFWLTRAVQEIPGSRYRHATTLQHLRARKLVRRTRSVHSRTRAPAKLVSTTMDFRAFVAKAPHLTILRQRTLVYGGKLLFSNATAKIPKAISQKRHDGFSFLNDGYLDKCLSKKKIEPSRYTRTLVVKPALSQMYDQLLPTSKSLEITCKHHCTHRSAPRHVSVPRSRNFSD